jgi:hypothetical protein
MSEIPEVKRISVTGSEVRRADLYNPNKIIINDSRFGAWSIQKD